MEFFQNAKVVRLMSYHDKYLMADDDKETVYLDRHGESCNNAKWDVEFVENPTNTNSSSIRLKSCFGNYLTATNMSFLLGATGNKVLQTLPSRLEDSSLEWEPIREGMQVRLKTSYGQYLRGNGGPPPWRNSVTHDLPHRTATANWILWDVEVVEVIRHEQQQHTKAARRQRPAPIAMPERCTSINSFHTPLTSPSPSFHSPLLPRFQKASCVRLLSPMPIECRDLEEIESPATDGRIIFYDDVADDDYQNGNVADSNKVLYCTYSKEVANVKPQSIQ